MTRLRLTKASLNPWGAKQKQAPAKSANPSTIAAPCSYKFIASAVRLEPGKFFKPGPRQDVRQPQAAASPAAWQRHTHPFANKDDNCAGISTRTPAQPMQLATRVSGSHFVFRPVVNKKRLSAPPGQNKLRRARAASKARFVRQSSALATPAPRWIRRICKYKSQRRSAELVVSASFSTPGGSPALAFAAGPLASP